MDLRKLKTLIELVESSGISELEVTEGEEKVRIVKNAVFAAPLRTGDGRDELVVVTRTDDAQLRSWSLVGFRFDGGKITRSVDPTPLYAVSAANARWIGAEVREIDLYLELANRDDTIEVGGLLTTRPNAGPTRDVVVISTVSVARRRGKASATDTATAETPDGGVAPREDGSATPERAKP